MNFIFVFDNFFHLLLIFSKKLITNKFFYQEKNTKFINL